MTNRECAQLTEQYVLHTYNRYPIALASGSGVTLKDSDGKEYLDFGSGIGVFALGYGDEAFNRALCDQIQKLIHTSNLFYHPLLGEAARRVAEASQMSKVFFTNSGTEAIEGALKTARKYAFLRDGHTDHEIISMNGSFHGRSIGALSVTGNEHYRDPFRPLMGGVRFAEYNNPESLKEQLSDKTCAILMEPVQGEGGIYPADPDFIREVRRICDERDILLIFDEIQCGLGRCGDLYACQGYGVQPDILTTAKALGCGFPVGAFTLSSRVAEHSLVPGDHGTTYGGNPLACAAVLAVSDQYQALHLVDHVRSIAPAFEAALDELTARYDFMKERRGRGLMQGIELDGVAAGEVAKKALEQGLIVLTAEHNVLRLLPPLIIGNGDIERMSTILEGVLQTF